LEKGVAKLIYFSTLDICFLCWWLHYRRL